MVDLKKMNGRQVFWLFFVLLAAFIAAVFIWPQDAKGPEFNMAPEAVESQPLKILFGGDVFLDRSIRRQIEANGQDFLWQNIEEFLLSYRYKVANLEGPIVNRAQAASTGSFSFAFQEEYIDKLRRLGFTAVSLANNHTYNEGASGLSNSRRVLFNYGINYFGDPNNVLTEAVYKGNFDGRDVAFLGEHNLYSGDPAAVLPLIKQLDADGYFVVVMPHWGPEYDLGIPRIEQKRAYDLIEAGADLIIGSHPHVVQPVEIYKDRVIFYSLGNFLFDQGFSYDTLHGLLVEVAFGEDGLNFKLFPTEQNSSFQISLAPEEARQKMLARMADHSIVDLTIKDQIRFGEFSYGY